MQACASFRGALEQSVTTCCRTMTTTKKTYVTKSEWSEMLDIEESFIEKRRDAIGIKNLDKSWEDQGAIGLTFSGGGIRSATFNLGIIQGLSKLGVLPYVDYLSTVSGGGYIGSCVTSLLSVTNQFNTRHENFPLNPNIKGFDVRDDCDSAPNEPSRCESTDPGLNAQVAHLRRRGNFIIPELTLFSIDMLRAIGASITGIFFTIGIFMTFFLAVAALHYSVAGILAPGLYVSDTARIPEFAMQNPTLRTAFTTALGEIFTFELLYFRPARTSFIVGTIVAVVAVFLLYTIARDSNTDVRRSSYGGGKPHKQPKQNVLRRSLSKFSSMIIESTTTADDRRYRSKKARYERGAFLMMAFIAIVAMSVTVFVLKLMPSMSSADHKEIYWLLTPLLFALGVRVGTVVVHPFFMNSKRWTFDFRSGLSIFQGYATYVLLFFLLATLLILPHYVSANLNIEENTAQNTVLPAATVILSALWAAWLSRSRDDSGGNIMKQFVTLSPALRNALLGILVWVIMFAGIYFYEVIFESLDLPTAWDIGRVAMIGAIAMLAFIVFGSIINYNRVSPHYFYRDRIAETFLMTETTDQQGEVHTVRDHRELCMRDINPDGSTGPYHIILGSLNLLGSSNLDLKDRKSDYFTFTRDYCGSDTTGYVSTDTYLVNPNKPSTPHSNVGIKLSRAIAISGAAVGSGAGLYSFFAMAFITTLFNVRLGYWMLNPSEYSDAAKNKKKTRRDKLGDMLFPYPLGENRTFWPKYLLQELFGTTAETSKLINLSDGAHTGDNTSLAPLLKRRCRVIVAVDAGEDGDYFFESLSNVIRQAYIDDRIEIDIDLTAIIPDATGYSQQHAAIGEIKYPKDDGKTEKGWLIVLKPTLTGDEPTQLTTYYRTNRDTKFPHQSTGDQFFDDDQFEAYRSLGEISVMHTFKHSSFFQSQDESMKKTILIPEANKVTETAELIQQTVVDDIRDDEMARNKFEVEQPKFQVFSEFAAELIPPSEFFSDENLQRLRIELQPTKGQSHK